jgi:hypothetical protein
VVAPGAVVGRTAVADRVVAGDAHLVEPRQLDRLREHLARGQLQIISRPRRGALDAAAQVAHRLIVALHLEQRRLQHLLRRAPAQQLLNRVRGIGQRDGYQNVVVASNRRLRRAQRDVDLGMRRAGTAHDGECASGARQQKT